MRLVTLLGLLAMPMVVFGDATDVAGLWLTGDGDGWIEISVTVNGPVGVIRGSPDDDGTEPQRLDELNPEPSLRQRPLLGLTILEGFEAAGNGKWKGGTIYDPNSGKTYRCTLTLRDDGILRVRGFIGVSLLGRTEEWTRVSDEKKL